MVEQSGASRQVNGGGITDAAARELALVQQYAADAPGSPNRKRLAWGAADGQVAVGVIPQRPPGFLPRPALFAQLSQLCREAPVVQVVTGTRGVGKTQLAAAYARAKLAEDWRLVAWVNAWDSNSLLDGLIAVADAAGLSEARRWRDAAEAGRAVRHWLEADGNRCLLVFDDVEHADVVRPFVPTGGAAQVLITTTQHSVADFGNRILVDVFSKEEAQAFIEGRTGCGETGATMVAAELGYLPLALAQAAAVIAAQHVEYEKYLRRLRAMPTGKHPTREKEQPYPPGVAESVLLSLGVVHASDRTGVCPSVMGIMALLSTAGVRREVLHVAGRVGALAGDGHPVADAVVDRALDQLADKSLLNFSLDGQTVIAHRLVTEAIRDQLAEQGRLTAACRAAASVLEACANAFAESENRPVIRDIPRQVLALLDSFVGSGADADKELSRVLLWLRFLALYHLVELGDSAQQAITVGESLAADLERIMGPDHPDTLNSRNSLAAAYRDAGRVAEAIPLFELTLAAREQVLGPSHPHTVTSRINLAAAYRDAGRVAEAIPLFELALATRVRLLGTEHPSTLNSQGNLAAAYWDAGKTAKAIPLFEQILAARERLLGSDHPSTLASMSNLASAYRGSGRTAEAIPLFEHILAARERLLGPEHSDTLRWRNNLAAAYRDVGRAASAIPLVQQNLAAREQLLGRDHSSTLASRNNLASVYRAAGRPAEAIPLFEQNLAACERLLGTEHPRTVASRHKLDLARREAAQADQAGRGSEASAEEGG